MKYFSIRGFVVALVVLLSLPMSCTIDDDPIYDTYTVVESYKVELGTGYLDSSYFYLIDQKQSLHSDSIVFVLSTDSTSTVKRQISNLFDFKLGSQLYATPAIRPAELKDVISTIRVYCSDTVSTNSKVFLPNEYLDEILSLTSNEYSSLSLTLQNYNASNITGQVYENSQQYIIFNQPIEPITQQIFTFELTTSDGKLFTCTTDEIDFL